MQRLALVLALLASINLAHAAPPEGRVDHTMQHDLSSHDMQPAIHQGAGVVKAIKPNKVQIAHEPIPSLKWPAMTMWFELKGSASHDIKAGDRVHFEMTQGERKKWVIEQIEKK